MADLKAEAERIRSEGTNLDYEAEALNSLARSWELCDEDKPDCAALALQDANVWATLHLARVTAATCAEPSVVR